MLVSNHIDSTSHVLAMLPDHCAKAVSFYPAIQFDAGSNLDWVFSFFWIFFSFEIWDTSKKIRSMSWFNKDQILTNDRFFHTLPTIIKIANQIWATIRNFSHPLKLYDFHNSLQFRRSLLTFWKNFFFFITASQLIFSIPLPQSRN